VKREVAATIDEEKKKKSSPRWGGGLVLWLDHPSAESRSGGVEDRVFRIAHKLRHMNSGTDKLIWP
jgi:hypothetical protein